MLCGSENTQKSVFICFGTVGGQYCSISWKWITMCFCDIRVGIVWSIVQCPHFWVPESVSDQWVKCLYFRVMWCQLKIPAGLRGPGRLEWKIFQKSVPWACAALLCTNNCVLVEVFILSYSVQSKPAVICTLRIPLGFIVASDRTFWDCLLKLHWRCSLSHLCGDQKGFFVCFGLIECKGHDDGRCSDSSSWSGEKADL